MRIKITVDIDDADLEKVFPVKRVPSSDEVMSGVKAAERARQEAREEREEARQEQKDKEKLRGFQEH